MAFIGASPSSTFASGTFTSDFLRSDTHDFVTGSIYSNEAGSLYIQQSPDGINWDVQNYTASGNTNAAIAISASTNPTTGKGFAEQIILPYWRVKFTATSGTAPTTLRLHARTSDSGVKY
jgi:hypothetical protein